MELTPPIAAALDPDAVARPVVTVRLRLAGGGAVAIPRHHHRKGQFLFVRQGALGCDVAGGRWIVPPGSALWIPGGAAHAVEAGGALEGYNAFVDPPRGTTLPAACRTVAVSPLLRALLIRSAAFAPLYPLDGAEARMAAVLLDEIVAAPVEDLHLPMPADPRLRALAETLAATPATRASATELARRAGMSERSLARAMIRETGMGLARWRQQLAVMLAVTWMADGESIQHVADRLGYESLPSFVTMFRRITGLPPRQYMTERHAA